MRKILFLLLLSFISFSQNKMDYQPIVIKENIEGILNRIEKFPSQYCVPRTVDIWLPTNYSISKKYNVLYMHDGQMLFDATITWNKQEWKVDEALTKLSTHNKIQNCIVVAIWNIPEFRHADLYPKKPFQLLSEDQLRNVYSEIQKQNYTLKMETINSDNYLKFIVEELKPYIDQNFSVYTDAEHTGIMGASMGGLISLYAICEYPTIFSKAACLSTHWIGFRDFENNPIPESFFNYMRTHLPDPKHHKIYFDYGTETLDASYLKYQYRVDQVLLAKGYNNKNYKNLKFEGENHSEDSWQKRIPIPIEFLFGK